MRRALAAIVAALALVAGAVPTAMAMTPRCEDGNRDMTKRDRQFDRKREKQGDTGCKTHSEEKR